MYRKLDKALDRPILRTTAKHDRRHCDCIPGIAGRRSVSLILFESSAQGRALYAGSLRWLVQFGQVSSV